MPALREGPDKAKDLFEGLRNGSDCCQGPEKGSNLPKTFVKVCIYVSVYVCMHVCGDGQGVTIG